MRLGKGLLAVTVGVASIGTVATTVWIVFRLFQGEITRAGLVGPIVTAFATITLVAITGFYVLYTKEIAQETRRARIQEKQPYFAIGFSDDYPRGEVGDPILRNIGNGPATELQLEIESNDESHAIKGANLPADGQMKIGSNGLQNLSNIDADIYDQEELTITGGYKDVFGKHQCTCQTHRMENIQATAEASR